MTMTKAEFAEGLNRIGVAMRQPPDKATLSVYYDTIGSQVEGQEWLAFARWCVDTDRFHAWFPKVADLRAALREFRGAPPLAVEATRAYERVLESGTYTPHGGTSWNYRAVRERCGEAAAQAFLAAGGNSAFAITFGEEGRRERFVTAYCDAARANPGAALLPAGPRTPALPVAGFDVFTGATMSRAVSPADVVSSSSGVAA